MASTPSVPSLGLECNTQPLGIAAAFVTEIVTAATYDTLAQLCDRPGDASYNVDSDSVSLKFDTELVSISITLPSEDAIQGSAFCRDSLSEIVEDCFVGQRVWGGQFFGDNGVTYAITQAEGADYIVKELEYMFDPDYQNAVASGIPIASGVASGYPVQSGVVPSGIASGFPTPTATVIASGVYDEFPGYHPSGVVSGIPDIPTPTASVTPSSDGWIPVPSSAWGEKPETEGAFNALGRVKREEAERVERPNVRWIQG